MYRAMSSFRPRTITMSKFKTDRESGLADGGLGQEVRLETQLSRARARHRVRVRERARARAMIKD